MDYLYERIKDDMEGIDLAASKMEESQIRRFYAGKNIFLTGCTGFIGKCITEKLLRGCPEMKRLYLLIRTKKGVSGEERLKKYFNHMFFDKLRDMYPDFRDKVITINGDLAEDGLGISSENRELLIKTTDVIIHNAGIVMFFCKFSTSMKVNVLGTRQMLDLASVCDHLGAFLYVSTGYVHHNNKFLVEEFLPPPVDMQILQDLIKADTATVGLTNEIYKQFVGKWKITYSFSKAMAESIVEEYGKRTKFYCGVFRPTIVIATLNDPISAWVDNLNGPVGISIGICLGFFHIQYLQNQVMDFVPADMTVNALLTVVWDMVENKKTLGNTHLYNYGSSTVNPVTTNVMEDGLVHCSHVYPSINTGWYYFMFATKYKYVFYLGHVFFHAIPCLFFDLYLLAMGKKPMATSVIWKLQNNFDLLFYFTTSDWRLEMKEMPRVWSLMNKTDHQQFNSDLCKLRWEDFFENYWKGIRMYVMRESFDNLPAARRKYKRLKILHYTVVTLFFLLFAYYLFRIMLYVFDI